MRGKGNVRIVADGRRHECAVLVGDVPMEGVTSVAWSMSTKEHAEAVIRVFDVAVDVKGNLRVEMVPLVVHSDSDPSPIFDQLAAERGAA